MQIFRILPLFLLFNSLLTNTGFSQTYGPSKDEYIIYSVKEGKVVEPEAIIEDFASYDVLFYGEQHNDIITHKMQDLLFRKIFEKFGKKAAISMEMFDRDVQYIVDEYLQGRIKEGYFIKDARSWGNYKDYRPMVEFAKEKGLKVIAANAPFRYVNLVNKFGLDTLMLLSEQAKKAMAPLPYGLASGDYAEKLRNLGKEEPGKKKAGKKKDAMKAVTTSDSTNTMKYDIIPGHSLWDATMAYSVFQYFKANPGAKIIHLNGSFHTEEYFGIVQRLKEYDAEIKPLVVTSVSYGKKLTDINFEEYKNRGDYIIFTKTKPE